MTFADRLAIVLEANSQAYKCLSCKQITQSNDALSPRECPKCGVPHKMFPVNGGGGEQAKPTGMDENAQSALDEIKGYLKQLKEGTPIRNGINDDKITDRDYAFLAERISGSLRHWSFPEEIIVKLKALEQQVRERGRKMRGQA